MSKIKLPGVRAWAWKDKYGLFNWAKSTKRALLDAGGADRTAKPVSVRLVEETELRRLLAKPKRKTLTYLAHHD